MALHFLTWLLVRASKYQKSTILEKKGLKGSEIFYSSLEMADYLLPFNNTLTINEKCELFAVRNKMINIPR